MKNFRQLAAVVAAALLAACSTPRAPAPITDRNATAASQPAVRIAEPVATAKPIAGKTGREADARGFYTVRRGDTLIHIALDFGQNYRDLITWNSLANPNDIKVDQVLRVMPEGAAAAAAAPGVQTAPVQAGSAAETRPIPPVAASASAAASTPAPSASAAANGKVPQLKEPAGEKRPYTEGALADLRKTDAGAVQPAAAAPAKPEARPADKPAGSPEDEALAWMWPTQGKPLGGFDEAKRGIDIAGTAGQDIVAAAAGKVTYAGNSIRGYGNLVIIRHTDNLLSAYAHNKTILVKENQIITKGQRIAEMGNSDSDAVKLHFEIRQQGKPVDPIKYLPGR